MDKLVDTPFSASISLSGFAWGTRIDMACTYGQWSSGEVPPPSNLGMVVVGRDGSSHSDRDVARNVRRHRAAQRKHAGSEVGNRCRATGFD